jgi:hypothetical protein
VKKSDWQRVIEDIVAEEAEAFDNALDDIEGEWLWCFHCERCYNKNDQFDVSREGFPLCPYEDCDGSVVGDGRAWEKIKSVSPDYPETPERGVRYPLYP